MNWRSIPTATAWLLATIGMITFVVGWQLGWIELFVVAAACAIALLVAVPFVLARDTVRLERVISPNRVVVGERAIAELRATNTGSRPSSGVVVEERIAGQPTPIRVPGLRSGQSAEFLYDLPTGARGVFDIGPATVSRGDPLGLLRRPVSETPVERLWVHPRHRLVKPLPTGFAKDLEGPTFDTSPAGDVAFHTIREYQPGDDVRHVHWMSTARKGTLMVRHYVDNRRPQLAVVVDGSLHERLPAAFERAVEVAASLGVSAMHRETPLACRVGSVTVAEVNAPQTLERFLDSLSLVEVSMVEPLETTIERSLALDRNASVLVVVTAGRSAVELLPAIELAQRTRRVVVVNVDTETAIALPRVTVVNAVDLDAFVVAWDVLT